MKKRGIGLAAGALVIILLLAAGISGQMSCSKTDFMLDTVVTVTARGIHAKSAVNAALDTVREVEAQTSAFLPESPIVQLNQNGNAHLPTDAMSCLKIAQEIAQKTNSSFDPTVKPLMALWNIQNGQGTVPDAQAIADALPCVGWDKLRINEADQTVSFAKEGMGVDLGGVAKGYSADRAAERMRECGVKSALIDLGGNIYALGKRRGRDWLVGLRDPDGTQGSYFGTVSVSDCAVVTSGGYERYFVQDGITYHHILNPKTGYPADAGLKSVTILSGSSARADALATACYVMGAEAALALIEATEETEAVLVDAAHTVYATSGAGFTLTSEAYHMAN